MATRSMLVKDNDFISNKPISPERDLMIAILDRAVLDYSGREGELHEKARDWIFGSVDYDSLFSYHSICDQLGIDPFALRQRINELSIPKNVSQAHRWLRSKVQSTKNCHSSV